MMMNSKGFTLAELVICVGIVGIATAICLAMIKGDYPIQTKQSCLSAGGQWSEGIQYGRMTQLCTYK